MNGGIFSGIGNDGSGDIPDLFNEIIGSIAMSQEKGNATGLAGGQSIPDWWIISPSGFETADQFREKLAESEIGVEDHADYMLDQAVEGIVQDEGIERKLALVSKADFGLDGDIPVLEWYAFLLEKGFSCYPKWVGPKLRLDYTNQVSGHHLVVASNFMRDRLGCPALFYVSHRGYLILASGPGNSKFTENATTLWVVEKP